MTRLPPMSFRSHCASHAPTAAGRCASSRPSGAARNRNPALHPERPPHDEMHVTIPRLQSEQHRFPGQYRHVSSRVYSVRRAATASNGSCKRCTNTSNWCPNQKTLITLDQLPQGQRNAFPIGLTQTPRLPPSHVSQRGPILHQDQNPRSGPHRKTLNQAAVSVVNDRFSNVALAAKRTKGGKETFAASANSASLTTQADLSRSHGLGIMGVGSQIHCA
jgi:hypothetical protein